MYDPLLQLRCVWWLAIPRVRGAALRTFFPLPLTSRVPRSGWSRMEDSCQRLRILTALETVCHILSLSLSLSPVSYGLTSAKVAAIHAWRTRTGPSAVRRRPTATALVPCRRTLLVSPYPTGPGEARTLIALSYSPFSRRSSSGSLRTRQKSRTS